MTSRNSSSGERRISQKELTRRRKWPIVCIAFFYFLSCIVVPLMQKTGYDGDNYAMIVRVSFVHPTMPVLFAYLSGILLALQGFSYLHSKKMLDFYESEPYTKKQRFLAIVLNSLMIFTAISLVLFFVGALLTGIGGEIPGSLAFGVFKGYLLVWSLAAAGFAMGTLAMMLTGNMIVAVLAVCVFTFYECGVRMLRGGLVDAFVYTMAESYWTESEFIVTSPIFNSLHMDSPARVIAANLLCAVAAMALAAWAFSRRKNESAGTAIVFGPVRHIVKIAMSVLVFMYAFVMGRSTNSSTTQGLVVAVIFGFIMGMVMEIIYDFNVAAFKNHLLEDGIILLACGLSITCMAAAGKRYDRYLPKAEEIVSSAVVPDGGGGCYDENGQYMSSAEFSKKYMVLEDTEDVQKLAQNGIETTLDMQDQGGAWYSDEEHGTVTIWWRLKNGKTIGRTYNVNTQKEGDLLEKITCQKAFREGFFQIYHDQYMREKIKKSGKWSAVFEVNDDTNYGGGQFWDEAGNVYEGFREAYMKDLENWGYQFSKTAGVDGSLTFHSENTNEDDGTYEAYGHDAYYDTVGQSFTIYREFTNTVDYLKSVGLYAESKTPHVDGIFGFE